MVFEKWKRLKDEREVPSGPLSIASISKGWRKDERCGEMKKSVWQSPFHLFFLSISYIPIF